MTREINEFDLPLMAMGKEASRAFSEQMNPTGEQMEAGKALKCPKCDSGSVARIIWGDPVYYDGLIQDIDEGRGISAIAASPAMIRSGTATIAKRSFSHWDNLSQWAVEGNI